LSWGVVVEIVVGIVVEIVVGIVVESSSWRDVVPVVEGRAFIDHPIIRSSTLGHLGPR